jgi:carbohydrate kinase (thermoresistant glucokinase family)
MALRIVVMGVSGSGKSTVGRALAAALGLPFIEGDELHPPRNVARMAAGTPLTDADRQGWLQAVAGRLAAAAEPGAVASCSALKRSYRDLLRAGVPGLRFVYLHGDAAVLAARMRARAGHYMPPSLLQSQLDTLEPPQPDEAAIGVDITAATDRLAGDIVRQLQAPAPAPAPAPAAPVNGFFDSGARAR